jgi:hypothetical protein
MIQWISLQVETFGLDMPRRTSCPLQASVIFEGLLLVLWRARSFVGDYASAGWGQTGFSGASAGDLTYVQNFFLALLHGGSSDSFAVRND